VPGAVVDARAAAVGLGDAPDDRKAQTGARAARPAALERPEQVLLVAGSDAALEVVVP